MATYSNLEDSEAGKTPALSLPENPSESIEGMEKRHKAELKELECKVRELLKGAKKTVRASIEAQAIQMEFDLKARQREEMDELEERIALLGASGEKANLLPTKLAVDEIEELRRREEETAKSKKAKAQKKKDKKASKEAERQQKKEEIGSQAGPSLRELELCKINTELIKEGFRVKYVASDGHCLYRAFADQLEQLRASEPSTGLPSLDFADLRRLAAGHMRANADDYAPFLGLSPSEEEYLIYCRKVESVDGAEWGGQLEIKALCTVLGRRAMVYSSDAQVLRMGEDTAPADSSPIRLAYHRNFYALGEHYNSVEPLGIS